MGASGPVAVESHTPTLEIHTSDRSRFKQCRQRWDFESPLRRNLRIRRGTPALTFGTAIHAGLEAYYHPEAFRTPQAEDNARQAFVLSLDEWYRSLGDSPSEDDELEYREKMDLGLGMLKHYFEWAPKIDAQQIAEVVWVEKEYRIMVVSPIATVLYSFKPDALVKDKNGRYWLMEHKTIGRRQDTENIEYLLMDDQCGSYLWGIREEEGIVIEGLYYNSLLKKLPSPLYRLKDGGFSVKKDQDTTYDVALRTLRQEYGSTIPPYYDAFLERMKAKGNTFFHREPVRRNQRELDILGEMILLEVRDMLNEPSIYRNANRYNCSNCAFVAPCIAKYEGSEYEIILEGNYEQA